MEQTEILMQLEEVLQKTRKLVGYINGAALPELTNANTWLERAIMTLDAVVDLMERNKKNG